MGDFRPDDGGSVGGARGAASERFKDAFSGSDDAESVGKKKTRVRRKKKPKKASRIESDDEGGANGVNDDNDGEDLNSDFEASESEDDVKKKNGRAAGRKRKSFVEESEDSEEETGRSSIKKRNVSRKSYVENSDEDENPKSIFSGTRNRRPNSVNDFVALEEEYAETPSDDSWNDDDDFDDDEDLTKTRTSKTPRKRSPKKRSSASTAKAKKKRAKKVNLSSEEE